MTPSRTSLGLFLAISLVWGSSWIGNEILRQQVGPLQAAMLRCLFGFVCLAFAQGCRLLAQRFWPASRVVEAKSAASLDQVSVPQLAILLPLDPPAGTGRAWVGNNLLLGMTMFALPELLLIMAAHHGAAAWAPLLYSGLPLGLLLATGELRATAILGLGAMLALLNGSLPLTAGKLVWTLPILGAVALQGWSLVYARRNLAAISTPRGVMVQLLTASCLMAIALYFWPDAAEDTSLRNWPILSLVALGVLASLATAIAYPLYYRLLAHFDPARLAVSTWLQTLVSVGESALLLRQKPGWPMIGAAGALLGCTFLLLRPSRSAAEVRLHL